jgi:hypothetical protein
MTAILVISPFGRRAIGALRLKLRTHEVGRAISPKFAAAAMSLAGSVFICLMLGQVGISPLLQQSRGGAQSKIFAEFMAW